MFQVPYVILFLALEKEIQIFESWILEGASAKGESPGFAAPLLPITMRAAEQWRRQKHYKDRMRCRCAE